jgi:hypothetical protein
MSDKDIFDFIKIFVSVLASVIITNYFKSLLGTIRKRKDVIILIAKDLIPVISDENIRSYSILLSNNKIFNHQLIYLRGVSDKYRSISKPIRRKYINIVNLIGCISEIINLIDRNYRIDLRYDSAIIIKTSDDNPNLEWELLGEIKRKINEYEIVARKTYAMLINKYPEIIAHQLGNSEKTATTN